MPQRRRQAAGAGGAVAAVAATVLATTQLLGGAAPHGSASVTAPGVGTMGTLLPGHVWVPAPDKFEPTSVSLLPYSFAVGGDRDFPLALSISTKPSFTAACANVWYPQTTFRKLTPADGTRGIEFDSLPSGDKPGGYELAIDLPGGRQLQFQTGYQAGGPQPVTLDTFLKLIKTPGFADYVKQYKAIMAQ